MQDDPYSLSDLARLADVTPRTVRYYVAQGLLPSPSAAGPATRYGERHLLRLRLIRRLQREHLPLAEIRARLERLSEDELESALDATGAAMPEPSTAPGEALAFVQALMAQSGVAPRLQERALETAASYEPRFPDAFPLREPEMPAPVAPSTPAPGPAVAPPASPGLFRRLSMPIPSRPATADRSTWERLSITPDVEIHVRRPLDRHTNKRVEQLARIARELFEDEP